MEKKTKSIARYRQFLNHEMLGRKRGIIITAIVSIIAMICALPFGNWIQLVNISKLFSKMDITREMAGSLYTGYSLFNLLSFVQGSRIGILGIYAMILLILNTILNVMFDKYAEIGNKTKFPNVNIYDGFSENYEAYQVERTAVSNVMKQYLAPLQAGFVDDVDAAVEEFRTKMTEAGIDVCREGFKEQWNTYCEEYGYK